MGLFGKKLKRFRLEGDDTTPVAGTSGRQKSVPAAGRHEFTLVADIGNKYDRNAVAVNYQGRQVGFIPAELAATYRALTKRAEKSRIELVVMGEVSEGATGRWVLLSVPPVSSVRSMLKN